MSGRTPIGVLVSGAGTNLDALLQACKAPDFPGRVALVVSKHYGVHLRADAEENQQIFRSLRHLAEYIAAQRTK